VSYPWGPGSDEDGYGWGLGGEPPPGPSGVATVILMDLPPQVEANTPIAVTVMVVDASGNPLSGRTVDLAVAGVTVTTPDAAVTNAGGIATFEITPEDDGTLTVQADCDDILSAVRSVLVAPFPVYQPAKGKTNGTAARVSTYLDVGPIAASPRPAGAPAAPQPQMQQPMSPAMARVAGALGQMVAQIESKAQAEAADLSRIAQ
jgi:hypothetical protein